jgi:hypothetical protein
MFIFTYSSGLVCHNARLYERVGFLDLVFSLGEEGLVELRAHRAR